uniref:Isoflavonoid 7-O-beta-apiosyl-glucoside beta-glycosidase n=1 Tax=Dalbergia nigrescens TaxID=298683 RepID=BAGBG_DALNI|nr:RecName: Full=Isoflavonoid 7-O-beta-apiosyl-glucoside beta-glycosidase; AltName: Full=Beta-glycosidase; Flags: Precursor [Dalbergia nigrescens]ABN70849.1 beta-glycosidase [Dalbergia nigrescens]
MHAMTFKAILLLGLLALVSTSASIAFAKEVRATITEVPPFNRNSFPSDFIFGTAASSYQYEGEGRVPSIWDNFTHQYPEKIADGSNGDVAVDQFHHYKEDVAIMKYMNLDAYRLSISWPRILPTGRASGGINSTGVDYYNRLINELLANDITPFVTIFHWDLPQALEDEYGGFLNHTIVNDFRDYADLCFNLFGDRVKHWITVNEPSIFTMNGYAYGIFAPGRCSPSYNPTCTGGDAGTEPDLVAHNLILSHAATVQVYKKKYQEHQNGIIGISLQIIWAVPLSNSTSDQKAAQRYLDFTGGWFLDPLTAGQYPESMQYLVGDRLPKFTTDEAKLVKGSFDFVGINYYTSSYLTSSDASTCCPPSYLTDSQVTFSSQRNGVFIGPVTPSGWMCIYPKGLRDLLLYIKEKYNNPLVYITENGMDELDDPSQSLEESLIDTYRIDSYYRHLFYVRSAIGSGANVKGFFAWSLLDNFEWNEGFTSRFGLNFVNYTTLTRYHKLSATWFKYFLARDQEIAKLDISAPKARWSSSTMIKEEKRKPKWAIQAF